MTTTARDMAARAEIFKALGHPARLAMVVAMGDRERCVCDLQEVVGLDMSTVSKHLSILRKAGIEVLLYDQKARLGAMLADLDLIGIPHRIVIGERSLDDGMMEYRGRRDTDNTMIPADEIVTFIKDKLDAAASAVTPRSPATVGAMSIWRARSVTRAGANDGPAAISGT